MAHTLTYQLHKLCIESRAGSHGTKAARHKILQQIGRQLKNDGYKLSSPKSLKPKHVTHLVSTWQRQALSPGTIKNRMSHLRWWAEQVGKKGIVPRSNDQLGIDRRSLIPTETKARNLKGVELDKVSDKRIRASLLLQEAFGLRREECIKIIPELADRGLQLVLKGSWCKGGRPRALDIRTDKQRAVLQFAKSIAKGGSLIPHNLKYVQQMKRFEYVTAKVGVSKTHGLRHCYAQMRYEELMGSRAPINGGVRRNEMSPVQKSLDHDVRQIISRELGHERLSVVAQYIGS
ncbi:integrase domain-containing protein [Alteromonas sp. ASW11-19]|uniref:Integrase domain-containing protein n=1 Tax=Alteromonas salexigens TaxID=2982530 RepID=A0ABT2VMX2_9ALTE|nr:phage integrase N-terminal domain-containing protein [Alteromonas salexigens]MCU7554662.1 integrase domain-containing protein [Alteromonas salexigens]